MADEVKKLNLRVLTPIRVKGVHYAKGSIIAKSAFPTAGDWQDLVNRTPAALVETSDTGKKAAGSPALPGA